MSDEDREPTGSGNGKGIAKRVGTADRDEAHWLWFLMIPVMGILLYGPDGGTKKGRGRDRGRNRGR